MLTEQSVREKKHLTAIECKYLKKKATKGIVMVLAAIMEDAGIESGIIVCKTGFTPSTLKYAEHKGIKLVELRVAQKNDRDCNRIVEIGTLEIHTKIMVSRATSPKLILALRLLLMKRR